jgi:putative transposase
VCIGTAGKNYWLFLARAAPMTTLGRWRAVDDSGAVLDILLQTHRNTQAAKTFFERLLINDDVSDVIHTEKLWSYGAAIRGLPMLHAAEHTQVISTARCNHLIEQSHRPTRAQERSQLGVKTPRRAQEFLALHARISNLHQHTRTTVPAFNRRRHHSKAHLAWQHAVDAEV